MLPYALRRLILALPLLVGITLISFVLMHMAPGEPTDLSNPDATTTADREVRERVTQASGLDKPIHVQYWNWLTRIVRLDFGRSFSPDARPVLQKIRERLPVTLLLNIVQKMIIVVHALLMEVRQGPAHVRVRGLRHAGFLAGPHAHDPVRGPTRMASHLGSPVADVGVSLLLAAAMGFPEPSQPTDRGRHLRRHRQLLSLHAAVDA